MDFDKLKKVAENYKFNDFSSNALTKILKIKKDKERIKNLWLHISKCSLEDMKIICKIPNIEKVMFGDIGIHLVAMANPNLKVFEEVVKLYRKKGITSYPNLHDMDNKNELNLSCLIVNGGLKHTIIYLDYLEHFVFFLNKFEISSDKFFTSWLMDNLLQGKNPKKILNFILKNDSSFNKDIFNFLKEGKFPFSLKSYNKKWLDTAKIDLKYNIEDSENNFMMSYLKGVNCKIENILDSHGGPAFENYLKLFKKDFPVNKELIGLLNSIAGQIENLKKTDVSVYKEINNWLVSLNKEFLIDNLKTKTNDQKKSIKI